MLEVYYSKKFIRQYSIQEKFLKFEIKEKIEEFKDVNNHKKLNVHKLHGKMKNKFGFGINYKYRIIFEYKDKNIVDFLTFGDHSIYE